jgi:hypothetical protein
MRRSLVLVLALALPFAIPCAVRADDVPDDDEAAVPAEPAPPAEPEIAPKPETAPPVPEIAPLPDELKGDARKAKSEAAAERRRKKEEDAAARREAEAAAEADRLSKMGEEGTDRPPEESQGFFITLDGWMAESSGAERTVARESEIVSSAVSAEDLDTDSDGLPDAFTLGASRDVELQFDAEISPQIEIGYRREGGGSFSARYWAWSSASDLSAGSQVAFASTDPTMTGFVLGTIDNPGIENDSGTTINTNPGAFERPLASPVLTGATHPLHGADSVTASSELDLSRIDLFYSRTSLASPRLELTWRVGLTRIEVERTLDARFTFRSFSRSGVASDSLLVEDVAASSLMDGVGPTVGAAARIGLTKSRRITVRFGLDVSGVKGSADLVHRDAGLFSRVGLPPQPEPVQDVRDDSASDFVTLIDGLAALEARLGQRARLGVGYRQATWMNVLVSDHFPSALNPSQQESRQEDLELSGPYLTVGFFF